MGLVRGMENDDADPVVDASGEPITLWMGPCASCGLPMTALGGNDDDEHLCPRCRPAAATVDGA